MKELFFYHEILCSLGFDLICSKKQNPFVIHHNWIHFSQEISHKYMPRDFILWLKENIGWNTLLTINKKPSNLTFSISQLSPFYSNKHWATNRKLLSDTQHTYLSYRLNLLFRSFEYICLRQIWNASRIRSSRNWINTINYSWI